MVRNREDADLVADYRVNDAERKAPCNETTSTAAPDRAEAGIL
jgi:hypothetical protein